MSSNTKSSVTLPASELKILLQLKRRLRAKTNVEVIRRALHLLAETTDREALRQSYARASAAVRSGTEAELAELDHLAGEGVP